MTPSEESVGSDDSVFLLKGLQVKVARGSPITCPLLGTQVNVRVCLAWIISLQVFKWCWQREKIRGFCSAVDWLMIANDDDDNDDEKEREDEEVPVEDEEEKLKIK